MRDEAFDYAVSSDLSRAYDTAAAICGDGPVHRDPRWREFDFGEWEGLTWDEICERRPYLRERAWSSAKLYAPEGGESFDVVQARVAQSLAELQASTHQNVLVVTHAGPLHAMLHTFFGDRQADLQEVFDVRFSPASVTRVSIENGLPQLLSLNEIAHLPVE